MIKITFSKYKDKIVPQVTSDFSRNTSCMDKNLDGHNLFISNRTGFMTNRTMFIGYHEAEAEAEPFKNVACRGVVESWIKLLLRYAPDYRIQDNAIIFNIPEMFILGLPDWND